MVLRLIVLTYRYIGWDQLSQAYVYNPLLSLPSLEHLSLDFQWLLTIHSTQCEQKPMEGLFTCIHPSAGWRVTVHFTFCVVAKFGRSSNLRVHN